MRIREASKAFATLLFRWEAARRALPAVPARRRPARAATRGEAAVADLIGSVLTIGITVLLMVGAALVVFAMPGPAHDVHADLAAGVDPGLGSWGTGDESVVLAHRGGQPLPANETQVTLRVHGAAPLVLRGAALGGAFGDGQLTVGERWSRAFVIPAGAAVDVRVLSGGTPIPTGPVGALSPPPTPLPGQPVLAAARGDRQVQLSWSTPLAGSAPLTNYALYRGTSSGGEDLVKVLGLQNGFADTGLANGTTYYYQVSALNSLGEGPRSGEVAATPCGLPGATVLAAARGDQNVALAWAVANGFGCDVIGYTVARGASPGGEAPLAALGNQTSYLDQGLVNGQTYYYTVRPSSDAGTGPASNEVSARPASAPGAPRDPSASHQGNVNSGQIKFQWSAPASNGGEPLTGYRVYRGTSAANVTLLVGDVGTSPTSFTDSGLTRGVPYYYVVRAVNAVGAGPPSSPVVSANG